MLPSASELHYFLEVANTLNISRAAERLGVSQPTLSLAVQRLEANLGTAVLIRNKSGVKLTHVGQKFVSQARLLLLEWERIRAEASKGERGAGGHPSKIATLGTSTGDTAPETGSTHGAAVANKGGVEAAGDGVEQTGAATESPAAMTKRASRQTQRTGKSEWLKPK